LTAFPINISFCFTNAKYYGIFDSLISISWLFVKAVRKTKRGKEKKRLTLGQFEALAMK